MATLEERTAGGVSFGLTDEQKALRQLAHDFAEREIRPKEKEYDEHSTHPADVIAKAHELGLMNVHIPEAYGGLQLGAFEGMIVGEELCWGCSGIGTAIAANGLGHGPVIIAGTEEQKRKWLPPLVDEVLLTSFALTEPNAGSDVSGIQTTAVRDGGDYVLNGSKMFITNAGHAAWFTVFASTDKSQGHRGLTAFVAPSDLDGVVVDRHLDKMGQRSTDTSALSFTDVRIPVENRLGEEGEGFKICEKWLVEGRIPYAAGTIGIAQAALEIAIDWARSRETFKSRLADKQAIQWMIADSDMELRAARLLVYQAAWSGDLGRDLKVDSSIAKVVATETAGRVVDRCIQILGGLGVAQELPLERWYRELRIKRIGEGPSEVHRMVLARQLLGRGGAA